MAMFRAISDDSMPSYECVCAEYVNVNVVLSCLSQVSTKVCTTFYDVSILALQNFKWHATFHSSRG